MMMSRDSSPLCMMSHKTVHALLVYIYVQPAGQANARLGKERKDRLGEWRDLRPKVCATPGHAMRLSIEKRPTLPIHASSRFPSAVLTQHSGASLVPGTAGWAPGHHHGWVPGCPSLGARLVIPGCPLPGCSITVFTRILPEFHILSRAIRGSVRENRARRSCDSLELFVCHHHAFFNRILSVAVYKSCYSRI